MTQLMGEAIVKDFKPSSAPVDQTKYQNSIIHAKRHLNKRNLQRRYHPPTDQYLLFCFSEDEILPTRKIVIPRKTPLLQSLENVT